MSDTAGLEPLSILADRVGAILRERRQTVAVAESSAGGLVSAALLAIPGASAFFLGGAVVYSRRAGKALLGLTAEDMAGMRAETEPYASFIAGRIRGSHRATWGIAESGAAGPSGSPYGERRGMCAWPSPERPRQAGRSKPPTRTACRTWTSLRGSCSCCSTRRCWRNQQRLAERDPNPPAPPPPGSPCPTSRSRPPGGCAALRASPCPWRPPRCSVRRSGA